MSTQAQAHQQTLDQALIDKMVFRKTNTHAGRHISVSPENSTMKHLAYGRIILNSSTPSVSFSNGNRETGLICLSGAATVKTAGTETKLAQYDAIYIPRDSSVEVSTDSDVDIAEFSSDVEKNIRCRLFATPKFQKIPA